MSSTLLERTRASHEELERLQRTLVAEMKQPPKTHREGVDQSHRISHMLGRISEASTGLEKIYIDSDGSRKDGIAAIAGSGPSLYSLFYDRLREIKEYHRKYPNLEVERPEHLHVPAANIAFSGEEKYGKYIDLNALFDVFVNLEGVERVDYIRYLRGFYIFDKAPESRLYNKQYKKYIDDLNAYLVSFFARTQPLFDLEKELQPFIKEFEEKYAKGDFQNGKSTPEPPKPTNGTSAKPPTPAPNSPPAASSTPSSNTPSEKTNKDKKGKKSSKKRNRKEKEEKVEEVVSEPMEVDATPKKIPDFENPLYCRACAKLFSKETVFKGHLSGKKHQQAQTDSTKLSKGILYQENRVLKMGEMLADTVNASSSHVEHKQSQTLDERQAELDEELVEAQISDLFDFDDDDDDDPPIRMTIKDYPIGWDGKPIPYWLYKLHGLGIEYKCEICGNTSYFGRKAFERHFQEWRHAHGMACLDIPNTRHFQEITKISDAVALWQKIKEDNKKIEWKADTEEEYEDSEGHVMAKKTFEDLRRQGLID